MMNTLITSAEKTALSNYAKTDSKANRTLANIILEIHQSGKRATDYRSPKSKQYTSTATPEQYVERKDALAFGLGAEAYKIYSAPKSIVKDWDDTKKAKRKAIQQDVGTYIDRIANKLDSLENPNQDKAPTPPVSDIVKMREAINKALKIAEKDETPTYNLEALTKCLNDAQRILSVRVTK
tara:strand:- start:482 stop:1024 length:543 start_codon:yes stop_codon:yes gene_type:complete